MEKRKYPRFEIASPMEYHLPIKEWGTFWSMKGVQRDISSQGFYFTCKSRLWMDVGDILDFNIDVTPIRRGFKDPNYLSVQGEVLRIEYLGLGSDPCGVGVQLLELLDFSSEEEH